jgi:hypothetical protein
MNSCGQSAQVSPYVQQISTEHGVNTGPREWTNLFSDSIGINGGFGETQQHSTFCDGQRFQTKDSTVRCMDDGWSH